MARKGGTPENLRPFQKGQSGNPAGRPKNLLRTDEVRNLIGKLWRLSREELQKIVQNPKSSMGEIMVASIVAKAAQTGDYTRVQFLLERTIGKVKDEIEVAAKPYIVERLDGSQVAMGLTEPDD